jgi:hypothetical protein
MGTIWLGSCVMMRDGPWRPPKILPWSAQVPQLSKSVYPGKFSTAASACPGSKRGFTARKQWLARQLAVACVRIR